MIQLNETSIKLWTLVFAVIAGIISAIWTISSYAKSNKIKAAEIFFNIEKNFYNHIPFLLEIENKDTYPAIEESLRKDSNYSTSDIETYQKLDSLFRHFTTCYQIVKLNIDNKTIETSYKYYLDVFINPEREEIRKYVRNYFHIVNEWLNNYEKEKINKSSKE